MHDCHGKYPNFLFWILASVSGLILPHSLANKTASCIISKLSLRCLRKLRQKIAPSLQLIRRDNKRSEKRILRQAADASPLSGSGHDPFLCCPGTVPGPRHGVPHRSFLTYALFLHAASVNNQAALFWGSAVLAALFPANIRKADRP